MCKTRVASDFPKTYNGDLDDPIDYGSQVRNNLMKREGYRPYCGGSYSVCGLPRLSFDGEQFKCFCGYRTEFDASFMIQYCERWGIEQGQRDAEPRYTLSAFERAFVQQFKGPDFSSK